MERLGLGVALCALLLVGCSDTADLEGRLAALESETAEQESQLDSLRADLRSATSRLGAMDRQVATLKQPVEEAYMVVDHPELALLRIANYVALLSHLNNYGGYQTTGSAGVRACSEWYLTGTGSLTDCGWQRVD